MRTSDVEHHWRCCVSFAAYWRKTIANDSRKLIELFQKSRLEFKQVFGSLLIKNEDSIVVVWHFKFIFIKIADFDNIK
jgi:hypothetical protein